MSSEHRLFSLERFLFVKQRYLLPLSNLLSAHVLGGTVPDDVFASEEERVHPFYRSGSAQLTQGALGRTPFQILSFY